MKKCPYCPQDIRHEIYRLHVISCGEMYSLMCKIKSML